MDGLITNIYFDPISIEKSFDIGIKLVELPLYNKNEMEKPRLTIKIAENRENNPVALYSFDLANENYSIEKMVKSIRNDDKFLSLLINKPTVPCIQPIYYDYPELSYYLYEMAIGTSSIVSIINHSAFKLISTDTESPEKYPGIDRSKNWRRNSKVLLYPHEIKQNQEFWLTQLLMILRLVNPKAVVTQKFSQHESLHSFPAGIDGNLVLNSLVYSNYVLTYIKQGMRANISANRDTDKTPFLEGDLYINRKHLTADVHLCVNKANDASYDYNSEWDWKISQ